jgi:hypothetical protein
MKLGILKARKKASVAALAPKYRANTMSRTKPRTREMMVAAPTFAVDFSSFTKFASTVDDKGQKYENSGLIF